MGPGLCQALLQVFSHSSSEGSGADTEREPQGDQVTQPRECGVSAGQGLGDLPDLDIPPLSTLPAAQLWEKPHSRLLFPLQ